MIPPAVHALKTSAYHSMNAAAASNQEGNHVITSKRNHITAKAGVKGV